MSAEEPPGDLVREFIAAGRRVISALLAQHIDDGSGHCRVCPSGPQAGRVAFPCRLRELAEEASLLMSGSQR
ncbi:hypothetical protein [Pseudonocardia kunmingensis]|uniref:hypothetical protein n=1 Tax=Pseudonocardia kunmingensis TaxID=630975 RepID=UPI00114D5AE1|nr:hypothetical protein [Pseudonocardia kunmingensis]